MSGKGFPHSTGKEKNIPFLICDALLETEQEASGRNQIQALLDSFDKSYKSYRFLWISFTSF